MGNSIGQGFDVHRLVEGRKLILGGVTIPYTKGLLGHSDADVLTHAIADALLGAAGLGDIGKQFPDDDEQYAGISSLLLLEKVNKMLVRAKFSVSNIDATIIAEKPRLSPFTLEMARNIAHCLGIKGDKVSIKATTTEGLGFTGKGEGIAALASVLLEDLSG